MKKVFIIIMALAAPVFAAEPTIKLRMDVSPKEITIGDPVRCDITVIYSSGLKPIPLAPATTGEFELVSVLNPSIKALPNDDIQTTTPVILTTFSTGTVTIQPFVLNFLTAEGQQVEAKTQSIDIHVQSLLEKKGDEGRLRPLKGTYDYKSYFWLWVTFLVIAVLVLAYYLVRHIRRKKQGDVDDSTPLKPAEETAWEALQKLEESDLRERGELKEFYVRLSTILRVYLEQRYSISCMERTTSELLADIRKLDLSFDTTVSVRTFIENGDLVKFAKFTPDAASVDEDLNRVKQFIVSTTPQQTAESEKIPV
jgi:hypothetical protein